MADSLAAFKESTRQAARGLAAGFGSLRSGTRAAVLSYSHDEREALLLLFLPFLLMVSAVVIHQSVRNLERYVRTVAVESELAPVRPASPAHPAFAGLPQSTLRAAPPAQVALAPAPITGRGVEPGPHVGEALRSAATPAQSVAPLAPTALTSPPSGPRLLVPERLPQSTVPLSGSPDRLAALAPFIPGDAPRSVTPGPIDTLDVGDDGRPLPRLCVADARSQTARASYGEDARSLTPDAFGVRLAEAAESQVGSFVVYTDDYRSISYPMGDVNAFFGVCTDVVIRAYRALGLDLQALVHEARAGSGDKSIDHRRTEVLRRFFAREGESLPITSFAEDYRPGDIVTYYRPQNRHTRSHIAIVSNVVAPSGRPMIVHNRGWGPALEDALFVDEITGHYRYSGPKPRVPDKPESMPERQARLGGTSPESVVVPAAFAAPAK